MISIDQFAFRHFDKTKIAFPIEMSPDEFVKQVNTFHLQLVDGYAPFCKHVLVPNFCNLPSMTLEITNENEGLLRTKYEARTEEELPVLVRFFPLEAVKTRPAKFLDLILYSKEQIAEENKAMGVENQTASEAPWSIISIKAQDENFELPMQPITMLRNALGKAEGGSGVPLDRKKYMESVSYWQNHASIL